MAIGTGTALAIGTGAMGLYGAHQAANASEDAAGMQADAANRAAELMAEAQRESLGFQRDVYNQTRTDQQPWIQAGQGSVNKLAHLMGIDMGGGGFTPLQGASGGGRTSSFGTARDPRMARQRQPDGLPAPQAQAYGARPAAYRWPGAASHQAANEDYKEPTPNNARPGFVPRRRQPSQVVQMQAPDGTIEAVPMEEVEMMEQAGAVRV